MFDNIPDDFKLSDYFKTYFPNSSDIWAPGSTIQVDPDKYPGSYIPLKGHPTLLLQNYDIRTIPTDIKDAIDSFKELMKGKNPENYRFLPKPYGMDFQFLYSRIAGFPVRIIFSYSPLHGCHIITIDTIGGKHGYN